MSLKKTRAFALPALLLAGAFALTSCGLQPAGSDAGGDTGAESSRIVVGSSNLADTLDPLQAADAHNDFNIAPMYDRIVDFDADGNMVWKLAESADFNDDATVLTLNLRKDVKFHSGNPLTANDVVYTLDRALRIGSGHAALFTDYQSSKAVDDTTVEIQLKKTNLDFLGALANLYVLDSELVKPNEGSDDAQSWLGTHEAGSGPFAMDKYSANQELDLARFADYWDFNEGRPDEVILRMINDSGANRDEFLAGNLDITMGLAAPDVEEISKNDQYEVIQNPSSRTTYAWLNNAGGITADPKVREAIQLAYDYQGHLVSALGNEGQLATSILPAGIGCRVEFDTPKQDLEKATQLIKEAGVEGSAVKVAYQPTVREFNAAGTLMQEVLTKIGLKPELVSVTYPQFVALVADPATTPEVGIAWDFAPFPAPGPILNRQYNSEFAGQTNPSRYSNPKVDELLAEALNSADMDQACDDFKAVQEQVIADHAALYIAYPSVTMISNKRVQGIPFAPTQQDFNVGDLRMAK